MQQLFASQPWQSRQFCRKFLSHANAPAAADQFRCFALRNYINAENIYTNNSEPVMCACALLFTRCSLDLILRWCRQQNALNFWLGQLAQWKGTWIAHTTECIWQTINSGFKVKQGIALSYLTATLLATLWVCCNHIYKLLIIRFNKMKNLQKIWVKFN